MARAPRRELSYREANRRAFELQRYAARRARGSFYRFVRRSLVLGVKIVLFGALGLFVLGLIIMLSRAVR